MAKGSRSGRNSGRARCVGAGVSEDVEKGRMGGEDLMEDVGAGWG